MPFKDQHQESIHQHTDRYLSEIPGRRHRATKMQVRPPKSKGPGVRTTVYTHHVSAIGTTVSYSFPTFFLRSSPYDGLLIRAERCPNRPAAARIRTGRLMSEEPRPYIVYLLRLWRAPGGGPPVWHASLEDPHTGVRSGFGSLEQLMAFLRAETGADQESPNARKEI